MTDQPTGGESRAVATRPERQYQQVQNVQPMLDTGRFEHFQRASTALMHSSILNPSIRGSSPQQCFSNLMLVFDLSDRWKLPAMSIAQGIAIVHDKVVYEGKLIAAMLDASLGVRLHYWWQGTRGQESYRIYVSDRPFAELAPPDATPAEQVVAIDGMLSPGVQIPGWRIVDGSVGEWRTFQKDGRTANPAWTGAATQNQLSYRGAREWARRFEPAQMLGVYGDDEIDAITIRMEARDVTPAAPGLSAGFARTATPVDAVVEPAEPAADAAQDRQEGGQEAQVEAKGPEAPADQAKPQAAKRTAKQQKVVDDRKAALEKAQDIGNGARDAAAWGYEGELLDLMGGQAKWDAMTDEERGFAENGWAQGMAALNDELEAAYNAGQMGVAQLETPDWLVDGDKSAERRWSLITDEHKRGLEERAAERAQDQADGPDAVDDDTGESDDALDAIREAEPDLVETAERDAADAADDAAFDADAGAQVDALDSWMAGLATLGDWNAIKASMNALIRMDAWTSASAERQAEVRAAAWRREAQLIEAGDDRMDFINDLTAFRCWIETTQDVDAINGNWMTLVRQPIYANLKPEQQTSLQGAVLKRVEQIQAATASGKS